MPRTFPEILNTLNRKVQVSLRVTKEMNEDVSTATSLSQK